ncbi:efflux RND transporter periplasmic adaptor subunit [Rubinisphaera italica]|uniref:HlyD family secretion protein n=1 Tax=Rubinisphaera italica TaxID=2527969 RepID=A0A5C5XGP1_9PLAN|nr:HlyD family efflux transporter periplasmic adaptor subunit [Rubinisphaera italica]TWT61453.1 HlyD family secretion protein [Rubinisphaera italica]
MRMTPKRSFQKTFCPLLILLLGYTVLESQQANLLRADEEVVENAKEADDAAIAAEPTTIKVETTEFLPTVSTTGIFVGLDADQIILTPKAWTTLKVVDAVEHGETVMEGDPLIVLETEDLDKAIDKAEKKLVTTTLSLRMATDELRFLKESTAMDLEQANRSAEEAKDNLDYYLNVQEQEDLKSAELNLKFSEYQLEYAQEELNQLTQMYEADDLTEQTEEIVLLRAKRDVEMAKRSVERAKLRHDRLIEALIPREKQGMIDSQARAALTQAKTVVSLPMMIQKKELDIEQMQRDLAESKEKLAEMKADRKGMTILAPRSGIVFYGQEKLGKWSEISTREKQLIPGGSVSANSVLMTVVDPDLLSVVADLTEEQLAEVESGQLAIVKPKSMLNGQMYAQVVEVDSVAQSDGKYKATLRLRRADADNDGLVPGMTCDAKIRIKKSAEAIMIPTSVIHQDEFSEQDGPYVWIAGDEPRKQPVTLGLERDKKQEILEGLKVGDEILKKAPTK